MPPAAYITTKLVALSKDNAANWVKADVKASEKGLNGKEDQWKVLRGKLGKSTSPLRLPVIQEFDYVLRADSGGGLEFPLFLANDEFTGGIKDGQAGNSLF
jgi:hypothetical protein